MIPWTQYKENQAQRTMIIMRGVSGSGKSTKARQVAGPTGAIFSTDDFFGPNYDFDPAKIPEAHQWNQQRARQAMEQGVSPVVIDNTNIPAYDAKPYVQMAQEFGYEVRFEEPDTDIWRRAKEANAGLMAIAQELAQRNRHGVPAEVIARMLSQYGPLDVEKALNSIAPWEKKSE